MSKSKLWKRVALTLGGFAIAAVLLGVAFTAYATPFRRENIKTPIFTIGDGNYAAAMNNGKNVVKFGPLPLGFYSGGVAFENREAAWSHLVKLGKQDDGWGVYSLSGDFQLDTYQIDGRAYIDKSLLVVAKADQ